ncbi:MAG: ZIP family metal transporter [Adlercreutzia equolifaciens]
METLSPFAFVTLVTLISGAGGTGLGGFIGALFKSESNRTISLLLAFAGGVMTAMVLRSSGEAEEAASQIAEHGVVLVIFAVALGVAVVYLLNHLIDRKTRKEVSHTADEHHPETHDDIDELVHADHLNMHKRHNDSRLSLFVAGVVMACAIALHNIPEGMTIGASFAVSDNLMWGTGMIMAVLIGLHNIPEGMAVAVLLISGGTGRVKATLLTAAYSLPTVLGAWLGFWLGDIGPWASRCRSGSPRRHALRGVRRNHARELPHLRSKLPAFAVMVGLALGMFMIFF